MFFPGRLKKIDPELDLENQFEENHVAGPVSPFVPVCRSLPEIHLICITTPSKIFEICGVSAVD